MAQAGFELRKLGFVLPAVEARKHAVFTDSGYGLSAIELVTLAERFVGKNSGVTFAAIDGNDQQTVTSFLSYALDSTSEVHIAAFNISNNYCPKGPEQGDNWVTYIEYYDPNIEAREIILLNTDGHYYSECMSRLSGWIESYYWSKEQEVSITVKDLNFQTDGASSCGIWVLEFLEKVSQRVRQNDGDPVLYEMLDSLEYVNPTEYIQSRRLNEAQILEDLTNPKPAPMLEAVHDHENANPMHMDLSGRDSGLEIVENASGLE